MSNINQTNQDICCPEFDPAQWDKKHHTWQQKKFITSSIPTLWHIPWPPMIGQRITHMWQQIEASQAAAPDKNNTLILFHDPSAFKSEIMISVAKDVPNAQNVTLSGKFVSRVFDGGYNSVPRFMKLMDQYLAQKGQQATDYYIHYAYCPQCSKKFGHNYMIIFAKV